MRGRILYPQLQNTIPIPIDDGIGVAESVLMLLKSSATSAVIDATAVGETRSHVVLGAGQRGGNAQALLNAAATRRGGIRGTFKRTTLARNHLVFFRERLVFPRH